MSKTVQGAAMNCSTIGRRHAVPVTYATIVFVAAVLDLLTDRSGGAFSLVTLPIALLAAAYFVIGQVIAKEGGKKYLSGWLLGEVLVLLGLVVFAMKGGNAPKDGELIFTYAMLISAPPASFLLPLAPSLSEGHVLNDVLLRSLIGWCFCVAMGIVQWIVVRWLMRRLRSRSVSRQSL
jgi:hypothetical protein